MTAINPGGRGWLRWSRSGAPGGAHKGAKGARPALPLAIDIRRLGEETSRRKKHGNP